LRNVGLISKGGKMSEQSEDIKSEKLVYFVVGAISLLLILVAELTHKDYEQVAAFCKELGMAGVIALIVIFTVESYTRKRHEKAANALIEKINSNLFHAIYHRHIPDEVFTEVEKCLMHSDVFRSQHEVMYTLTKFAEDTKGVDCTKHVKCEALSTYKLKNVSNHEIKHNVVMMLERPIDVDWDGHVKIVKAKINGKELTSEEIEDASSKGESQVVFTYPTTINIGQTISVRVQALLVKQRTDQEVWASRLPSDGLKIIVQTPDKDFTVNAKANHNEKLELEVDSDVTKKWVLPYGIIPYQSVSFWWHSKEVAGKAVLK
jgi:hypothetical protein